MAGAHGRVKIDESELEIDFEDHGAAGEHMKAMWAGQSHILVATRVRPLMKHDVIKRSCVRAMDGNMVVIMDPATGDKQDVLRANRSREKQYAFDHVFDGNSTQESIYRNTTKFLIHGVLDGYNATVFAYGQTGSGKTYTMIGTQQEPGIMVRVMADLFLHSSQQGKQQGVLYKVSVSFLEVYNENIRDLLGDAEEYLDLREDPIKGPVVAGITEVEASSGDEIMSLLHQGNAKRSQAATAANEVSSRSHAVLQVLVEGRDRAPGVVANIKVGKLSLVDLAGSERAANTKNTGARLVEGANINRSLLALGNCINALGEKGNKGNFVPYRDSKLTRLLKDSLGGNCRTVMIANISSAESSFEETLNTLKYANRAKNIKTNAQRNVLNVNYHISEYVQLINNLRNEIKVLKDQISANVNPIIELGEPGMAPAIAPHSPFPNGRHGLKSPSAAHVNALRQPSTPLQILRESLRSATSLNNEGRELVNNMRKRIVDNFQERMQLRRSLIELEDQNVQNSIEVSKRQLIVVQWADHQGRQGLSPDEDNFAHEIEHSAPAPIREAWTECEQIRKAISKNNGMKKNIAKRLKLNEKEAESFRDELSNKITGEDRLELMELQYQVGRLELENMELEQHRIVHESIVKGKDLIIQKLKLQLAVKDKLIAHQQRILIENGLQHKIGSSQLALLEQTMMRDVELGATMAPPSPPRNISDLYNGTNNIIPSKMVGGSPQKLSQLNINALNAGNISSFDLAGNNMPLSSRSQNDVDELKADIVQREMRVAAANMKSPKASHISNRSGASGLSNDQDGDWEEYSEFSDNEEYDEESDMSPANKRGGGGAGGNSGHGGAGGIGPGGNNISSNKSGSNSNNNGRNIDSIGVLEGRAFGNNNSNNNKARANANANPPASNANAPQRNGRHYRATVDDAPAYPSADSKQPLRPAAYRDNNQKKYQQDYPSAAVGGGFDADGNYSDESDSQSYNNNNRAQPKIVKGSNVNNADKKMNSKASAERLELFRDPSERGRLNANGNNNNNYNIGNNMNNNGYNGGAVGAGAGYGNPPSGPPNPNDLKLHLKTRQEQIQAQQRAQQQQFEQLHLSPGRGGGNGNVMGFRNNAMIFPTNDVTNSSGKDKEKEKISDRERGGLARNNKQSNSDYSFDDFRVQGVGQGQQHNDNNNDRKIRLQQHLQLASLPDRDYPSNNNNDAYIEESYEEADTGRKMPQIRQSGMGAVAGAGVGAGVVAGNKNNVVLSKLKSKMAAGGSNNSNNNGNNGGNNNGAGLGGGVSAVILPSAGPAMAGLDVGPSQLLAPMGGAGIGGVGRPNNFKANNLNNNSNISNNNNNNNRVAKPSGKAAGTSTSTSDSGIGSSSNSNNNNGGGIGLSGINGDRQGGVPLVPHIGGRNRSLPNLSKQNSGPNSARSSKGDEK